MYIYSKASCGTNGNEKAITARLYVLTAWHRLLLHPAQLSGAGHVTLGPSANAAMLHALGIEMALSLSALIALHL